MSNIPENLLNIMEKEEEGGKFFATAQLVALGKQQGYVAMNDLLKFFPEAENDVAQLDEVFAALLSAGIPFVEEDESDDDDSEEDEKVDAALISRITPASDNPLAQIDTSDMVGLYLKQAAEVPLLTAEEEVILSKTIEKGREARAQLASGEEFSDDERDELLQSIMDGSRARERLIISNSRLVISVAKKYIGRGVPFLDLIQEGNIGLMRAAKKFDYKRGYKFSTYATWWIRQATTRAIADQGRTIRVPVHMGDQINKLRRMQHQLKQKLAREPTREELAEALELPIKKVENMIKVSRRPLSLEMPIDDEGESMLGDFIEDQESPAPDETASLNLMREHLEQILDQLPPREVRVLQLRYGLLDGKVCTLQEVGRKMGVTRERVRQIEAQALRRLRRPTIYKELREYIG
jgi:RNA polymerase primary sigma factor